MSTSPLPRIAGLGNTHGGGSENRPDGQGHLGKKGTAPFFLLSHFTITAKLGAGGMDEVYVAENNNLGYRAAALDLIEALRPE